MSKPRSALRAYDSQPPMIRLLQCFMPAALLLGWQHNDRLKRALRQAQDALRDVRAQLDAVVNCAPVGIVQTGLDGRIQLANHCYCQMVGHRRSRLRTLKLHDMTHPEDRPEHLAQHAEMLVTGQPFHIESRLVRADESHVWVISHLTITRDANGQPMHVIAAVQDLSQRRAAEAALQAITATLDQRVAETVTERVASQEGFWRAQRMEALGQLAGGVAHDFNNVLQAIVGGARLIQRRPGSAAAVERLAGLIVDAAERGATVTQRLLSFARRGPLQPRAIEAAGLLTELREVLTGALGSQISIRIDLPSAVPALLADRGQLETALVNLATNARDAMGDDPSVAGARGVVPMLRLSAAADDGAAAGLPRGRYVRIDVSDNGAGMGPGVLDRATEPFFTTKAREHGTGLGLAMARGFAEQSGGKLTLHSQAGQGTTASLLLPQAGGPATPATAEAAASAVAKTPRIMLVDDDVEVLEIMDEMLTACGYVVSSFDGAADALQHLDGAPQADLLITDLSMPDTDGLALIQLAQRHWPSLPAILLTGHNSEELAITAEGMTRGRLVLLQKPIRIGVLLKQVTALLTESGPSLI